MFSGDPLPLDGLRRADVNLALAASKEAVEQLIVAGERSGSDWSAATAPGKWSSAYSFSLRASMMAL